MEYTSCLSYSSTQPSDCGKSQFSHIDGLFILGELNDYVNIKGIRDNLTEKQLIINRLVWLNYEVNDEKSICAKHRHEMGIYWRPQECQYPDHVGNRHLTDNLGWNTYDKIKKMYPAFPILGGVCKDCRKLINSMERENHKSPITGTSTINKSPTSDHRSIILTSGSTTSSGSCYVPQQNEVLTDDDNNYFKELCDKMFNIVGAETPNFIIQQEFENVRLNSFGKAWNNFKTKALDIFCNSYAPRHTYEMKMYLLDEKNEEQTNSETEMMVYVENYNECRSGTARQAVLTMAAHKFSKQNVMKTFDVSKYQVDVARKRVKQYGPITEKEKVTNFRSRLDMIKAEHFLSFLSNGSLLQEEAYGITTIKYDSGDKIKISNSLLMCLRQHAIKEYQLYCSKSNYDCLSFTTLYKILDAIKPKSRRRLAGVDNFLVHGYSAIEKLQSFVELLSDSPTKKQLGTSLNQIANYLKTRYENNCELDSECSSHCAKHGLSSVSDNDLTEKCTKQHNKICRECFNVVNSIEILKEEISKLPQNRERNYTLHEIDECFKDIMSWQKHLLRSHQQEKAKYNGLQQLHSPDTALWIRDWAQKILPGSGMESQDEYFGKSGISLHIDVFLLKVLGVWQKAVYYTMLDKAEQDLKDVLSIADVVLGKFQYDCPQIKKIYVKSDNAGCYHANSSVELLQHILKTHGFEMKRYDYNEPQRGKDVCDREAAYVKQRYRNFLDRNSSHKITNAKELLKAVMHDGGPKQVKGIVISIDKSKTIIINPQKISNIKNYHSYQPTTDNNIKYFEYYEIGKGKVIPCVDVQIHFSITIETDWIESQRQNIEMSIQNQNKLFYCREQKCIAVFATEIELLDHESSNFHRYVTAKTSMDKVRDSFVQKKLMNDIQRLPDIKCTYDNALPENEAKLYSQQYGLGWARPIRRTTRFSEKQTNYIKKLFDEGEKTKKKMNADQIAAKMKVEKLENGKFLFAYEEYLKPSQIKGLIQRFYSKKQTLGYSIDEPSEDNEDDIIPSALEEIEAHFNKIGVETGKRSYDESSVKLPGFSL